MKTDNVHGTKWKSSGKWIDVMPHAKRQLPKDKHWLLEECVRRGHYSLEPSDDGKRLHYVFDIPRMLLERLAWGDSLPKSYCIPIRLDCLELMGLSPEE